MSATYPYSRSVGVKLTALSRVEFAELSLADLDALPGDFGVVFGAACGRGLIETHEDGRKVLQDGVDIVV